MYLELNNDNNDDENTNVTCTKPKWLLLSLKLIPLQTWSQRYNSSGVKQRTEKQFSFLLFSCKKAKYEEYSKTNVSNHFKNQFHISLTLRTCHSVLVPEVILLVKVSSHHARSRFFFHAFSLFTSNLSSLQQVICFFVSFST